MTSSMQKSKPGWPVVVAAFFGVMAGFGSLVVFTFSVFLKPVSAEFGWSREAVSTAFGLAAVSVALASPKLGQLLDRLGPRRIILPCYIVYGLALCSLAFLTSHIGQYYATFVIIGLVGNATTQMGYSRAVSTWFDARRGLALALVMSGTGLGSILLPAASQWVIDQAGWRNAYLSLGCFSLICGIPLTVLFVHERPMPASSKIASGAPGATTTEGLRSRAFWTLIVVLFLNSISVNGAITHLSPLLTDRGIAGREAALAISVLGAASLSGRLLTGLLLDRFFGPRVAFGLLIGVAAGIQLLSSAHTPATAIAAAALIGLGLGGEADITPYLLTRYFGLRSFSTLYGFTWTAYAIAGAIGPVIMGRAFDLTGSYALFLSILASAGLVSAFLMLAMPQYDRATPTLTLATPVVRTPSET